MQRQSSYKVHLNTICNGELSDPLCDSENRDLTLVRLRSYLQKNRHEVKLVILFKLKCVSINKC